VEVVVVTEGADYQENALLLGPFFLYKEPTELLFSTSALHLIPSM